MIKKIGANQYGVVEFVCSRQEEIKTLPHLLSSGSTCVVTTTGDVFIFDEEDMSWHSLVDSSMVIKPESAYNKPTISSLTMTPTDAIYGEAVEFVYEATYDESSFKAEEWVNKKSHYSVGTHMVGVRVQDGRDKWSDFKYMEVVIPEPKAPVISNFRIEPSTPKVDESVQFFYDVKFENERITKQEEIYSDSKQESYDSVGEKTVELKVKDSRNIWSKVSSLTFNVDKKIVNKEESEQLVKTINETYQIPTDWTFSSVNEFGSHSEGTITFTRVGQCVIKLTKSYEEDNVKGTITKTVTVTVNKEIVENEESQQQTVKANQKYSIPQGYNFVSVDGVGSRVLETNEIIFSGTGSSTVKAKKVEESETTTTNKNLTITITVEDIVPFNGYVKITSEDGSVVHAEGQTLEPFNLELTANVKIAFYGNGDTQGLYRKQYSNIQVNGAPLNLQSVVATKDESKIESHNYSDGTLKIATKYTGTNGAVYYVVEFTNGDNAVTFECSDWAE